MDRSESVEPAESVIAMKGEGVEEEEVGEVEMEVEEG